MYHMRGNTAKAMQVSIQLSRNSVVYGRYADMAKQNKIIEWTGRKIERWWNVWKREKSFWNRYLTQSQKLQTNFDRTGKRIQIWIPEQCTMLTSLEYLLLLAWGVLWKQFYPFLLRINGAHVVWHQYLSLVSLFRSATVFLLVSDIQWNRHSFTVS